MRSFLSLAAVALLGAPALAADDKAKDVLAKAIDAMGGEKAIKKYPVTVQKTKGTIVVMGMEVGFTSHATTMEPDKLKQIINVDAGGQEFKIVQIVNGDKASMTFADTDTPLSDEQKADLTDATFVRQAVRLVPLTEGKGFEVKLLDEKAKVEDKEAYVLSVSHKKLSSELKLFVDAKTYLVVKAEKEGSNGMMERGKQETFLSDYKKVDGVMLPMKTKILHEGKQFLEVEVTEAKLLETVEKGEFEVAK